MGQQALPFRTCRLISARREDHIRANRVSQRIDRVRRLPCPRIGVDPHVAEVVPEARFQALPCVPVQRRPLRSQYVLHDCRHPLRRLPYGAALQLLSLLAFFALAFRARLFAATAFALQSKSDRRRETDRRPAVVSQCGRRHQLLLRGTRSGEGGRGDSSLLTHAHRGSPPWIA